MEVAQAAREEAGLDPMTLSSTGIAPFGVFDDLRRARRSVTNMVTSAARFALINGSPLGPADDSQRKVFEAIGRTYDMSQHGLRGTQNAAPTDEFIDQYAIVGSPARCAERILELHELGIAAIQLGSPQGDSDPADMRDSYTSIMASRDPRGTVIL